MNLKDQVTNLELSKILKNLGVKQQSLFYWSKLSMQNEYHLEFRTNLETSEVILADCTDYISAYTVAELGSILPKEIPRIDKYNPFELSCEWRLHYCGEKMWHIIYESYDGAVKDFIIYDRKEADARAEMLIFLIKNGHIDVKDLNK